MDLSQIKPEAEVDSLNKIMVKLSNKWSIEDFNLNRQLANPFSDVWEPEVFSDKTGLELYNLHFLSKDQLFRKSNVNETTMFLTWGESGGYLQAIANYLDSKGAWSGIY